MRNNIANNDRKKSSNTLVKIENKPDKFRQQQLHIVLGASGGIGNAIIKELHSRGIEVIGINRSGYAEVPKDVKIIAADVYDLYNLLPKIKKATHIYNALNVPYTMWDKQFVGLAETFIEIIKSTDAKGIVIDNLYMYGEDIRDPFLENMPYLAKGKKGRVRSAVAKLYDEIMDEGKYQLTVARGPDIYGPGITQGSFYGNSVFGNAVKGKSIDFFGKLDKKHAMIYAPDFGRAVVDLALSEDAYGEVFHVPHAPAITQQEFANLIFQQLNMETKIRTIPNLLLNILSIFSTMLREVKEMKYEFENEYTVDTSKFENLFGSKVTSHEDAVKDTLVWFETHKTQQ